MLTRLFAALVLVIAAPGLGSYQALAQTLQGAAAPITGPALQVAPEAVIELPTADISIEPMSLGLELSTLETSKLATGEKAVALSARTLGVKQALATAPKASAGSIAQSLHGTRVFKAALTGRRGASVQAAEYDALIEVAAAASKSEGVSVQMLNAAPEPSEPASSGKEAPLAARLFAATMAAVPGVAAGAALLFLANAPVLGVLTLAATAGLVTLPFMGEKTPRALRAVPGAALGALGVATVVTGFGAAVPMTMGALVALGGWGLVRLGRSTDKYLDDEKVLTAYVGAIGAVVGATLVGPAAPAIAAYFAGVSWLPQALTISKFVSYAPAAMLLMNLPGWVGSGISAIAHGLYASARGADRVLRSIKRDTVLQTRLSRWTEQKMELSKWNFWKVGVVWAPIWVVEGVMFVTGVVFGLALGVLQAPSMFLWGAAHKLSREGKANKFFAALNHTVLDYGAGSKVTVYNPIARPLVNAANSESRLKSLPAALVIRVLQLAWAAYAAVATPFLYVVGFAKAFGKLEGKYESSLHSPDYLGDRSGDDRPAKLPEVPAGEKSKDIVPPALIAAALVAVPLYFFIPNVFFGFDPISILAVTYGGLGLSLAAMPLLKPTAGKGVRKIPGYLLTANGVVVMGFVGLMGLLVGTFNGLMLNAIAIGAVSALAGLGLVNFVNKLDSKDKVYSTDDPEYIGAFLGALGVMTGLGLSLGAVTGTATAVLMGATYLSSLLLLMHLPRWFWSGIGEIFSQAWDSIRDFERALNVWQRESKFYDNLREQKDYHLDGSVWKKIANGIWLGFLWVPLGVTLLAELAASLVLGLAAGIVRAPVSFLWGALYKANPDSKATRFVAGVGRSLRANTEGSYKKFLLEPAKKLGLIDAMGRNSKVGDLPDWDNKSREMHRPSLAAYAAVAGFRVLQAVWLVAVLALNVIPVIPVLALLAGVKNASGEKKKDPENPWNDEDRP